MVDQYVTEGRAMFMSRLAVIWVFPLFMMGIAAIRSVILFKRGYESEDSIEKMSYLGKASAEAKRSYDLYPKDVYKQTWDKVQKAMKE